ncbi:hypothetical protein CpB0423 [Chlamydia pneumoniae TW-183]|uniref:Uncharacterized protein n=1 Tax=Chlamydia pneumoniae TaxID=83558 RepID=A0ABM5LCH4_CHLPN|nr:hypothetical protein CpB0423 [Chlamydia pneumoniae TW-183]
MLPGNISCTEMGSWIVSARASSSESLKTKEKRLKNMCKTRDHLYKIIVVARFVSNYIQVIMKYSFSRCYINYSTMISKYRLNRNHVYSCKYRLESSPR